MTRLLFGCLLLTQFACIFARGDDRPWGVELVHRDSLAGWTYGSESPKGWSVRDGMIHAENPEGPLFGQWSFGDFELQARWTTKQGAKWTIECQNKKWTTDHQNKAPLPIVLAAADKDAHAVRIERRDDKLSWFVDDKLQGEQSVHPNARCVLQLMLTGGSGTLSDLQVKEPPGKPIFNGKDLTGWWTPGSLDSWPVIDGNLVCINKNGNYLRSEEEYGNYTLSLEYRIAKGGNSGVGIRTPRQGWPSGDGMELQIMDEKPGTPVTRHSTMAIYGNLEPLARADRSETWNHVVIKTEGRRISAWVNGRLVQYADTSQLPELRHRNLKGWIGFQDHGARTEFRNINLLVAPDGTDPFDGGIGFAIGSQIVADRYMNVIETILHASDTKSHSLICHGGGDGEHVVAELAGPGALVELMRNGETGRVAMYIDGAAQPAVKCDAAQLHTKVPNITEERKPLLTYIPFRTSLKIVTIDGKPTQFRLDYLTFGGTNPGEFAGPEKTMSRGLLPALSYRFQQGGWGGHREHDPYPRAASPVVTLKPGESQQLIGLDGQGTVTWTKLTLPLKKLTGDDLWLEVAIDGESEPSIAAPARYWYPGLSERTKYQNFMVTDRNGLTNYLAIPYHNGAVLRLSNRGQETLKGLQLSVSYNTTPPSQLRLHGLFLPAGKQDLLSLTGSGRVVGLVCADDVEKPLIPESFVIDGQPQPVNDCPNLRFFLGLSDQGTNETHALCGVRNGLAWRWFLPAPLEFQKSLKLSLAEGNVAPDRWVVYYTTP